MICPACGTETPAPLDRCFRCSTPFPSRVTDDEGVTLAPTSSATAGVTGEAAALTVSYLADASSAPTTAGSVFRSSPPVAPGETSRQVGETFGRYRIIKL